MCTVSVVFHANGVRLVCNRDEKRARSRALTPRVQAVGGHRAMFPIDPDGGGTWVGVNSSGLVAALLNRTGPVGSDAVGTRRVHPAKSRGAIVPHVLAAATVEEAIDRVDTLSRVPFGPFRLLLLKHRALWILTGGGDDGLAIERTPLLTSLVLASSSLGDWLVEGPRRALFHELMSKYPGSPLEAQSAFHTHSWPARPEISVVMSRRDARTVSRTQIDVVASLTARIEMRYREISETGVLRGLTPGSDPFLSKSSLHFREQPNLWRSDVRRAPQDVWGLTPGSDPVVIHKDSGGAPC